MDPWIFMPDQQPSRAERKEDFMTHREHLFFAVNNFHNWILRTPSDWRNKALNHPLVSVKL
jgi:hypothetical protein